MKKIYLITTMFICLFPILCVADDIPYPKIAEKLVKMAELGTDVRTGKSNIPATDVDRKNTARLKKIIKKIGWPTIQLVGKKASNDAFLIVQHSDLDPKFQEKMLELIEPLAKEGLIRAGNFAYLYDRVNRPQRFGTQGWCIDGVWVAREMKDPTKVEALRRQFNMMTFKEYTEKATLFLCKKG
jgi:hypothetical protein